MSEQTQESNKLIAEFMGMKFKHVSIDSHNYEQYSYLLPRELSMQVYGYEGADCFLEDQFSKSWDWLMPVVEKIENMPDPCYVQINGKHCDIWNYFDIREVLRDEKLQGVDKFKTRGRAETKIGAVYFAVVQFIQWYKTQHP